MSFKFSMWMGFHPPQNSRFSATPWFRVPGYTPPDAEKVRFREVEGLGWMLKLDENRMIP